MKRVILFSVIVASVLVLILSALVFQGLGLVALVEYLLVCYGWLLFSFFHYRYVRHEELLNVLTAAAEASAPLSSGLWAYVSDRPTTGMRDFWMVCLCSLLFMPFMIFVVVLPRLEIFLVALVALMTPGLLFYFLWYRRQSYDRKVERVAMRLESGYSLHQALRTVPGVASRETELAAAIGATTGKLASCLRIVPRVRLATVWLEAFPRLVYPLLIFVSIGGILSFHLLFIAPKLEKIFADFKSFTPGLRMPDLTRNVFDFGRAGLQAGWSIILLVVLPGAVVISAFLFFSSTARWYFPVVGWIYRMQIRSRGLKMLAVLLEAGLPVPQALGCLADSGYFAGTARRRWNAARQGVEKGEGLAAQLFRHGLVTGSMTPLLQAAERANNLTWALHELGDHLDKKSIRITQRISLTIFPTLLILVGLLTAAVVLAFFLPLITLITEIAK